MALGRVGLEVLTRAVLFDLDDTLFDHRGCSRDALAAVQKCDEQLGAIASSHLEEAHARVLEELHRDVMLGKMPLEQARLERFRRLLGMSGGTPAEDVVALAAATYRDRYKEVRRAVRGARELLQVLRGRVRVGIVSNNLYDEQREKLEMCGLAPFIDALVVSERVGVSKPDPAMFLAALDELKCQSSETVMVGDSWAADVLGALAAGIRPIWFNPLGLEPPGAQAIEQLRSLEPATDVAEMILDLSR